MNLDNREDREVAAGQYVIGLLDDSEQRLFEARLAVDTELATLVARWQDQLLPLTDKLQPLEPPASLWQRIDAALEPPRQAAPSPALEPPRQAAPRPSLWNSLFVWRSISAIGVAASVLLTAFLVFRPPQIQVYYAVLRSPTEQVGWLVQAKTAGVLRLVPLEGAAPVPEGKALELWTKAEGASGPTSLGLVRPGQVIEIPVDQLPALESNQLFEITLEPETGSPIGRPTGPILFIGRTDNI